MENEKIKTIDKKAYYKYQISISNPGTHYRAIFYNKEDIPPFEINKIWSHLHDMVLELKANKPYTVWYGNELFPYLPYLD